MNATPAPTVHGALALQALEALLQEGLALPDAIRYKLAVPSADLDRALRALHPRELRGLSQAIFRHAHRHRAFGPLPRPELLQLLADLARHRGEPQTAPDGSNPPLG